MPDQPCITLVPSTSVASGCFKCHKPSTLNLLLTSFAHLCLQPGVCGSCCYTDEISTNLTDSHKHKIHSQIHKKPQCKHKAYHIDRTHTGKISYDRKFKIMLQFGSMPIRVHARQKHCGIRWIDLILWFQQCAQVALVVCHHKRDNCLFSFHQVAPCMGTFLRQNLAPFSLVAF